MADIQRTGFSRHGQSAEWSYYVGTGDLQEVRQDGHTKHDRCTFPLQSHLLSIQSSVVGSAVDRSHRLLPLPTETVQACQHLLTLLPAHTVCVFIHIWLANSRSTATLHIHFDSCGLFIFPIAIPRQPFLYQNHCTYIRQRQVPRPSV